MARIACALALLFASAASAERTLVAQGKLTVTARVVDHAKVEMAEVPDAAKARQVKRADATEWTVPMRARVDGTYRGGASVELRGCEGTARWREAKDAVALDQKETSANITAVVKNDPTCAPIVVVTVLPDGAPPAG